MINLNGINLGAAATGGSGGSGDGVDSAVLHSIKEKIWGLSTDNIGKPMPSDISAYPSMVKPLWSPARPEPLCFTAVDGDASIWTTANVVCADSTEYSYDKRAWTPIGDSLTVSLSAGQSVYFRGKNPAGFGFEQNLKVNMEGKVAASGNMMSLLEYEYTILVAPEYAFSRFFNDCQSLVSAPELPATKLNYMSYYQMFTYCSSLIEAPELPATELGDSCYESMFESCSSLIRVHDLPATSLATSCYQSMFSYCTSLTKAPKLPAIVMKYSCYEGMFSDCANLTEAPELPAVNLGDSCYNRMFANCSSLIKAPELPARSMTGKAYVYEYMFSGCTSLVNAPALPATELGDYCYLGMFYGCEALTEAPELPSTKLTVCCYQDMFNGCSSLTDAPVLPALDLASSCYARMFQDCCKLNYVKAMFTTLSWTGNTTGWLSGVASAGTFVKNVEADWNVSGASGIPNGWTVETASA